MTTTTDLPSAHAEIKSSVAALVHHLGTTGTRIDPVVEDALRRLQSAAEALPADEVPE